MRGSGRRGGACGTGRPETGVRWADGGGEDGGDRRAARRGSTGCGGAAEGGRGPSEEAGER